MNAKPCEHTEFHQHYNDYLGDEGGYSGEIWETGIRCTQCGHKWPDPEWVERGLLQEHRRSWEHCSVLVGTDRTIITSMSFLRNSLKDFKKDYSEIRKAFKEKDKFSKPGDDFYVAPEEIGPINDKFFAFHDDCIEVSPPIKDPMPGCEWKMPYTDEWNLFWNLGMREEMPEECYKHWVNRRLTYEQAVAKIKAYKGVSYEDHPLGRKQYEHYKRIRSN